MPQLKTPTTREEWNDIFTQCCDDLCGLPIDPRLSAQEAILVADLLQALSYLANKSHERSKFTIKSMDNEICESENIAIQVIHKVHSYVSTLVKHTQSYDALVPVIDIFSAIHYSDDPSRKPYLFISPINPIVKDKTFCLFFSSLGEVALRFSSSTARDIAYTRLLHGTNQQRISLWHHSPGPARQIATTHRYPPFSHNSHGRTPVCHAFDPITIYFPTYPSTEQLVCDFVSPSIKAAFLKLFVQLDVCFRDDMCGRIAQLPAVYATKMGEEVFRVNRSAHVDPGYDSCILFPTPIRNRALVCPETGDAYFHSSTSEPNSSCSPSI